MRKIHFIFFFLSILCTTAKAQGLNDLFTDVDTIFMPGASPGGLAIVDTSVTPVISSSPCNTPTLHFSVAAEYKNGRVLAIAHEALLSNNSITWNDNLRFLTNAMNWLNPGDKRVSLKQGWINNGNSSTLQGALASEGYTFSLLTGDITGASLVNTDILILGNDWNGTEAYSASELSEVEAFVADGGSVLIAGLGWSWPQGLDTYPMNAVAKLFGFEFTRDVIYDPDVNVNGAPKFYNFYPDNIDTGRTPYCPSPFLGRNFSRGENLRILRLAVSTMGEFTRQSGGVQATEALIEEWMEEINDIYGREYCVRFELIPNNDQLIFPDPGTDPWGTLPPGSGGCNNANIILSRQAAVIDSIIGSPNYDISHVIAGSPFGGGCAGGLKSGLSGGLNIPVTRHEIGHQFSQSHTINHGNNTNYEPENGAWTIQGGNSRSRAHAVSFHQLANFLANVIPDRGTKVSTGNTVPMADAGPDFTIPVSTPFTLTATVTNTEQSDSITYVWDNMSRGIPQSIPVSDDSQGAIFMRLLPDTNSTRTFPRMSDVIANNNSNGQEQLPTQARIMDMRLTVNDNHRMLYNGQMIYASGTHSDDMRITVADAGPFTVTSQNTSDIVYRGGSEQLVTWDVNGTDAPPVNTEYVRISLSLDGGYTYPVELLEKAPNIGSALVIIPNIATSSARIKVSAVDNIYFDINTEDFEIEEIPSSTRSEFNDVNVKIYPNPTNGIFRLELPAGLHFKAYLYDQSGQVLLEQSSNHYFDLANIPGGQYFLEIIDLGSNRKVVKKLIYAK
jgi:hypothetical protein